jgi:hypothetical protein
VARELQFLQSHTVHHYAVIHLMLLQQGIRPDPEFGVAPSTLRHEAFLEQESTGASDTARDAGGNATRA